MSITVCLAQFLAFVLNVKEKDGYSNAFEIQLCFKACGMLNFKIITDY